MADTTALRGLTQEQVDLLLSPLHPSRVRHLNSQSHLEAWDVRRWLTRIFGFSGWCDEILSCQLVHEQTWPVMAEGKPVPGKNRCTAVYRVTMRLIVKDRFGNELTHFDDGATGDSVNQPSVGDAHDMAMKTAMSQALKRCAVNLGDQFGLSLYNKGKTGAVVMRVATLGASPYEGDTYQDAPVEGGELDEAREQPQVRRSNGAPPEDDAWAAPPHTQAQSTGAAPKANQALLKAVNAVVGKRVGSKREARLGLISQIVGREITSSSDLTTDEARGILAALAKADEQNAQPAGPPEGWTPEQSDHLAADFFAELQGARTDLERTDIAKRIAAAVKAGELTAADRETLLAAYTGRQPQPAGAPA